MGSQHIASRALAPQAASQKTCQPCCIEVKTEHDLTLMARVKRWRVFHARSVLGTDAPARRNFHILRSATLPVVAGAGHDLLAWHAVGQNSTRGSGEAKLGPGNSVKARRADR